MEDRIYLIDLYDIYGDLLTDKQKQYFEDYYFNNLTLSEMKENYLVSRNAIHKQIKETEDKLNKYEEILKLKEKKQKIKELLKEVDEKKREAILELL